MMSSSLFAILLIWVSSALASRPMPLAVTWYSPVSTRSQRGGPVAVGDDSGENRDNSNSDRISVIGANPDSNRLMQKSTSILYGDDPPLTSLRLDGSMDEQWLHNTLEPDMGDSQSDTDTNPASNGQAQIPETRDMVETLYSFERQQKRAKKRGDGHSLSVVNPVDVLRQRMLKEAAREMMRQNQDQIEANAQLLTQIGKRQTWHQQPRWLRSWDASKVALEDTRTQTS